jgi:GT2 family glycosyltransferase
MKVSIFILYYKKGSLDDLLNCVRHVKKSKFKNIELIVVNNGLERSFKKELLGIYPGAVHINKKTNTGFTGGNIEALKHASGDIVLLLNDDAIIHPEAITNAVELFQSSPDIGIVGGKVFTLSDNHPPLRESNPFHTYQKINPFGGEAVTSNFDPIIADVDSISGSMFFIRRKVINSIGFLDDRFFAYYEETDLAARARLAGWRVVYSGNIKLWHKDASTNPDPLRSRLFYYQLFRNQFLFAANNFSKDGFIEYLKRYFYRITDSGSLSLAARRPRSIQRYFYQSVINNFLHLPETLIKRGKLKSAQNPLENILVDNNLQDLGLILVNQPGNEDLKNFMLKNAVKIQEIIIIGKPNSRLKSLSLEINSQKQYQFIRFSSTSIAGLNPLQKAVIESRSNNLVISYKSRDLDFKKLILTLQKNNKLKFSTNSKSKPSVIMASKNNWLDYFEMQELKTIKNHLQELPVKEVISLNFDTKNLELRFNNLKPKNKSDPLNYPVFINCRDRAEPLKKLLSWLKNEGIRDIILIDNNSTNPELLKIYQSNRYEVIKLNYNSGHISLWNDRIIKLFPQNQRFIYTDPDIIPEESAHGAIIKFNSLLNKYPEIKKVGFGLKIDDLPNSYHLKKDVIAWEKKFWKQKLEKDVFKAPIDTTFALCRESCAYLHEPALRTGGDLVAKHEPWYTDSDNPSDDLIYYLERADRASNSWGAGMKDGIAHHQKNSSS